MAQNTVLVQVDLESIVKLRCLNALCKYNLAEEKGLYACNLKNLELDESGICRTFEFRVEKS